MSNEWQRDGACVDNPAVDLVDFFPDLAGNALRDHIDGKMRPLCSGCLVLGECRAWVNRMHFVEGFVAGETGEERIRRWEHERELRSPARRNGGKIPRPVGGPALP